MLLVVPTTLVMVLSLHFGATMKHLLSIHNKCRFSFGVIQGLEVIAVATRDYVALWHHLQVGSDTVVAGTCVIAEVNHAAFISALIRWFDSGEAEFMGDVASNNLHNLTFRQSQKRQNSYYNNGTVSVWTNITSSIKPGNHKLSLLLIYVQLLV